MKCGTKGTYEGEVEKAEVKRVWSFKSKEFSTQHLPLCESRKGKPL